MEIKNILKKPLVSEKIMNLTAGGKYGFAVAKNSTKPQIARAVESIYGVHVENVKVINVKGKRRVSGRVRKPVYVKGWKKALVKLAAGEKIDIFEGGKS